MSAVFKNARKTKISQTELRKYMNEHKNKLKVVQKIDSPLAKYPFVWQLCKYCRANSYKCALIILTKVVINNVFCVLFIYFEHSLP